MTADAIHEFERLASERAGHKVRSHGNTVLEAVVEKAMLECGARSWDEFIELLKRDTDVLERIVGELSVKETYFFRTPEQFRYLSEYLRETLVPARMIAGIRRGLRPHVRVWSIGCATGEEVYSIAAVLNAGIKHRAGWDVEILATDISEGAVSCARRGVFSNPRVAAGADDLLELLMPSVLVAEDGTWLVSDVLKRDIVFGTHNILIDPLPAPSDVVFCRNLMVYMPPEAQSALVERLWTAVRPGGLLFMGDAELLHVVEHHFEPVWLPDAVAYRRPDDT